MARSIVAFSTDRHSEGALLPGRSPRPRHSNNILNTPSLQSLLFARRAASDVERILVWR